MENLNLYTVYSNTNEAYNKNIVNANSKEESSQKSEIHNSENLNSKIHNSAVNVSISMESIKVFLNIKSTELSQNNVSAQNLLNGIINNPEMYDFLSGKELDGGFSLKSIGYEGKALTELSVNEAKNLVSEEGFFGITQTSSRVSSFVMDMSGDNIEALQGAREGIVQGFNQAEKMWGGTLPEISYETQKRTLEIVDAKIAELLKTDVQKEAESLDIKE
ncbi:MAG: hydrogenase-4 component G [Halarcobacter sp.]